MGIMPMKEDLTSSKINISRTMRLTPTLNASMEGAEAGVEDNCQDEVAEAVDVDVDTETKDNVKSGQGQGVLVMHLKGP